MMKRDRMIFILVFSLIIFACNKSGGEPQPPVNNEVFKFNAASIDGRNNLAENYDVRINPVIRLSFSAPVSKSSVTNNIVLKNASGTKVNALLSLDKGDSVVIVSPQSSLNHLSRYSLSLSNQLMSAKNRGLGIDYTISLLTSIDSTDKFPLLSEADLLDTIQRRTFKYFWDFGHPISGLARERNTSGDVVTSGGSGMGIMAILVGINRNFISKAEGLARITTMVDFLTNTAQKYNGAFPHWLNGATGATVPFSTNDNGADLVETSYLMQGLLCARQYFNTGDAEEVSLRSKINVLWNNVEWNFFRKNNENVLYWHWSPDKDWIMNMKIQGWNEALITYVLAASSTTYTIDQAVYVNGWAQNGAIKNGTTFYNYDLPLGPSLGGPLFFEHYSFLGINPGGLTDQYADYNKQTINHTLINYEYCKANPGNHFGYSSLCWGLTASDTYGGYSAHSPTNDLGVISPTAALSSFPYTPAESMNALKFFYYKLGDKLWKEYGFVDAFSLKKPWFADSFLAIDQGPVIIMIENYRSGLLWNLFTSCPEVKDGMRKLGFSAPYL